MLEKNIETALKQKVEADGLGAKCLKFVTPGFTGVPDRIILMPPGIVVFVETKRPGQVERQRQLFVQSRLRKMGFPVFAGVDSMEKVDCVIRFCRELRISRQKGGDA